MKQYELIREDGWKLLYKNDPAFPYGGDYPLAKVHSYFVKRGNNEVEVDVSKSTPATTPVFDRLVSVAWVEANLNHKLKYKRKWYGDQDIYNFVVLQNYIDQCKSGNYEKCLLSSRELAMILPNKK
jgi:hypothetical protein